MNKQYQIFQSILIDLLHSSQTVSTINDSFKCLLHFIKLQKNTQLCQQILIILLFKPNLSSELKSIFSNFVYNSERSEASEANEDDIHYYGIKSLATVCHLSSTDLITKYLQITKNKATNIENDELSIRISTFLWNALDILFILSDNSTAPPLKKRKLNNDQDKKRNNYLSIAWLNYLSSNDLEIKIYHLILTRLESVIFRVFKQSNFSKNSGSKVVNLRKNNNIILLADFLTDSYNIGGEISLLSLKGLFILINDYNKTLC